MEEEEYAQDDESVLTEQKLRERVRIALKNNNDEAVFANENKLDLSDWSDLQVN